MIVKVLGVGCAKCKTLEKKLQDLKTKHNLNIEIEKVTELDDIIALGVMMTPGLIVNDQVKSTGKIPKDEDLLKWIREV